MGTSGQSMWAERERPICRSALKPIFVTPAMRSAPAPRPPAPHSALAQAFSGMSAHRPAPLTPFSARSTPFPLRSALTCADLTHASAKRCQHCRLKPSLSKTATSTFSLFIYLLRNDNGSNKLCGRLLQYVPPPVSWPLTIWPWKWCPSHVSRGLHLY